jgi:hypothetical protein
MGAQPLRVDLKAESPAVTGGAPGCAGLPAQGGGARLYL